MSRGRMVTLRSPLSSISAGTTLEPIVDIFDDLTHNRAVHARADLNALNFELQWELADLRCLRLHAGYGGLAGRFMNKLSRWNAVAQV
jgi:hypothetical protein